MNEQDLVRNYLSAYFQENLAAKVFLLAAPAWGKTSLVLALSKQSQFKHILYVSPLTAINTEFQHRVVEDNIKLAKVGQVEGKSYEPAVLVLTPEKWVSMQNHHAQWLAWADLVVVDEMHLFMIWDIFRPLMREFWLSLALMNKAVLGMSGSFKWKAWQDSLDGKIWIENTQNMLVLDLHREKLLYLPTKQFLIPRFCNFILPILVKAIILLSPKKSTIGLFVPRRNQVYRWERWARKFIKGVISCVGGEGNQIQEKLLRMKEVSLIVSTSVLSHGVNLPRLRWVIIMGHNWEEELWQQMCSRAGRRGESYYVLAAKPDWMKDRNL